MARNSRRFLVPFVAGLAAGAVAVAVSIILKETSGGLFLPEVASQALFSVTPMAITNTLILIWFDIAKSSNYDQIILYKEYPNA